MITKLKRIMCCLLCAAVLATFGIDASAVSIHDGNYITVIGFDANVDYTRLMRQCAVDGSKYALQVGAIYEKQRNLKITTLGLKYEKTSYFTDYNTGKDILAAMDAKSKIDRLKAEYKAAGQVYEYLTNKGFSDVVIAGILGNMMAECGGQTLNLRWNIYGGGGSYYGLCQWSLYYNPSVNGRSITGQLDYLMSNIESNMRYFGGNYGYFRSIKDAGEAARYFGNFYERGAGANTRARNAYAALKWIKG